NFQMRFKIELRLEVDQAIKPESAVIGLEPGQPAWRVLVAEDMPDNRLLLTSLLTEIGFEVKEAENGERAVALFQQWQPHFIWMDMRMPVMDGFEATRRIRELPGGEAIKIVALTASAFMEQRKSILDTGCDDIVHKPFRRNEIFDAMENLLGVRFVHEELTPKEEDKAKRTDELTAARLKALPEDLQDALLHAAEVLDHEESYQLIDKIQRIDSEFADSLSARVDNFQYDQILELFEKDDD
ncbi:MAG: response regulator, partial [Sedimenticola sp.]